MSEAAREKKQTFSLESMNKVWDLSNSEYLEIIVRQKKLEAERHQQRLAATRSAKIFWWWLASIANRSSPHKEQ
jgi:hypothetical protein